MLSKRIILFSLLIGFSFICKAQTVSRINMVVSDHTASLKSVEFLHINTPYCVGLNGNFIQRPGTENNLSLTYYDEFDGQQNIIGKLKSIGSVKVTYYSEFDGFDNIGKLKSIGDTKITYYDRFDGGDNIGKLKSIGDTKIAYYTEFDGFDNIGKLKSIGNTKITYYDRFDISQPTGKIKSIDGDDPYLNIITI
ncbi:MAG TPA: hypothetical protein VGN20_16615 [Mucilaginibacter sp.]|jgi:hypothetical protein